MMRKTFTEYVKQIEIEKQKYLELKKLKEMTDAECL